MRSFDNFGLCSITPAGPAIAAATGLGTAATLGISAAMEAAIFAVNHYVGEGRKTANSLTHGLQQDFTDQVLKPLAVINQSDPAQAHALMEKAWPTFLQKTQSFADQGGNQAKVASQMLTPGQAFLNTVTSILGRNPFPNGGASLSGGKLQLPATTMPLTTAVGPSVTTQNPPPAEPSGKPYEINLDVNAPDIPDVPTPKPTGDPNSLTAAIPLIGGTAAVGPALAEKPPPYSINIDANAPDIPSAPAPSPTPVGAPNQSVGPALTPPPSLMTGPTVSTAPTWSDMVGHLKSLPAPSRPSSQTSSSTYTSSPLTDLIIKNWNIGGNNTGGNVTQAAPNNDALSQILNLLKARQGNA